jgi:hypothetical protein
MRRKPVRTVHSLATFVVLLTVPAKAQVRDAQPQALPSQPASKPRTTIDAQAESSRRMDATLARQERAAEAATRGICDGCIPAHGSRRQRAMPAAVVGDDGLPLEAED